MPITLHKTDIGHGAMLGICEFDYNGKSLEHVANNVLPTDAYESIKKQSRSRQEETIAVYTLLREMTRNNGLMICHEESGRPFLIDTNTTTHELPYISISHTRGFATIITSTKSRVAVDIEYISNRIHNIAERFIRNDEREYLRTHYNKQQQKDTEYTHFLLVYWCAKETMYKYYSDPKLTFEHIKVGPLAIDKHTGIVTCTNMYTAEKKTISYTITEKYVITYCL